MITDWPLVGGWVLRSRLSKPLAGPPLYVEWWRTPITCLKICIETYQNTIQTTTSCGTSRSIPWKNWRCLHLDQNTVIPTNGVTVDTCSNPTRGCRTSIMWVSAVAKTGLVFGLLLVFIANAAGSRGWTSQRPSKNALTEPNRVSPESIERTVIAAADAHNSHEKIVTCSSDGHIFQWQQLQLFGNAGSRGFSRKKWMPELPLNEERVIRSCTCLRLLLTLLDGQLRGCY
jgi:hypothetical protein